MSQKAYKLKVADIKKLCDFFLVDRTPSEGKKSIDKDELIDRLLDFLGAPDEEFLNDSKAKAIIAKAKKKHTPKKGKGTGKSGSPGGKKSKKGDDDEGDEVPVAEEVDDEDVGEEEEDDDDPSDKQLRKWVKCYIGCFNLDKATPKHAVQTASDKFGVDLNNKKARIKQLLTEEIGEI
mmetsp:Transcript_40478/g.56979  ORF Transcript_40478/g.56979 Transcript_40478/m.56979 type:complete len:178 (+) Transcript_40478:79-612(+)